jgi:hypothetical protein
LLMRLLLLLLPVFAALTASVASSHAQAAGYHPEAHLSAEDSSFKGSDDPFALPACSETCLTLAESCGDGSDDGALLRAAHAVPTVELSGGSQPIDPLFSFLRYRTSEPRAPPAQV